jgi:hypothetical protein
MDIAVIRKIIETSSAEMLSEKARSAAKRKRDRAAARTPVARTPVPDDMNAEPVLLESYEQSIDSIDSIDGPLAGDDGEEPLSDIEALHEVETEIGIATWLDAETGEPAQGACPPHLDEQ